MRKFCGFVAIGESYLREIWRCDILWHGKSEQSVKVFSAKAIFFTNLQTFSPSKFPAIQYCSEPSLPSKTGLQSTLEHLINLDWDPGLRPTVNRALQMISVFAYRVITIFAILVLGC